MGAVKGEEPEHKCYQHNSLWWWCRTRWSRTVCCWCSPRCSSAVSETNGHAKRSQSADTLWLVHLLCLKSNNPFYLREPICITCWLSSIFIHCDWNTQAPLDLKEELLGLEVFQVSVVASLVVHVASMECYTFPLLVMCTEWLSIKHRATLGHAYRNILGLILLQRLELFSLNLHTQNACTLSAFIRWTTQLQNETLWSWTEISCVSCIHCLN